MITELDLLSSTFTGCEGLYKRLIFLSELFCDPRGRPYDNRGTPGYSWISGGYAGRGGYDDRGRGVYNGGVGRAHEDRNRGYQPVYDMNRGGNAERENNLSGGRGYYSSKDSVDNIGEGTVGFYGRTRRP